MNETEEFYLQDRQAGLFFERFDSWTADPDMARKFPTASLAYEFALLHEIRNVKVIGTRNCPAMMI